MIDRGLIPLIGGSQLGRDARHRALHRRRAVQTGAARDHRGEPLRPEARDRSLGDVASHFAERADPALVHFAVLKDEGRIARRVARAAGGDVFRQIAAPCDRIVLIIARALIGRRFEGEPPGVLAKDAPGQQHGVLVRGAFRFRGALLDVFKQVDDVLGLHPRIEFIGKQRHVLPALGRDAVQHSIQEIPSAPLADTRARPGDVGNADGAKGGAVDLHSTAEDGGRAVHLGALFKMTGRAGPDVEQPLPPAEVGSV